MLFPQHIIFPTTHFHDFVYFGLCGEFNICLTKHIASLSRVARSPVPLLLLFLSFGVVVVVYLASIYYTDGKPTINPQLIGRIGFVIEAPHIPWQAKQ